MGQTVGDKMQQVLRLAENTKNLFCHCNVLQLASAAYVVDFAIPSLAKNQVEGAAVIGDVDPVADVLAISIHRQRLARERSRNHQPNKFFGKLDWTIVVGAA